MSTNQTFGVVFVSLKHVYLNKEMFLVKGIICFSGIKCWYVFSCCCLGQVYEWRRVCVGNTYTFPVCMKSHFNQDIAFHVMQLFMAISGVLLSEVRLLSSHRDMCHPGLMGLEKKGERSCLKGRIRFVDSNLIERQE
uniref:uncharacterized protein LOC122590296 isoform X2 n=1 Tax=Erigeron canadensis TaxID=72917 RepID=UPI001CB8FFE7|nr:uncharacterized protein LOC122590296 isoform X2 [Erigeron canadensis]